MIMRWGGKEVEMAVDTSIKFSMVGRGRGNALSTCALSMALEWRNSRLCAGFVADQRAA
jgi:hypothetical protein